jgi:2-polyprenyl-6-methoxyphenol hydroxylase-like FAD-dependent oxidoreductase
MALEDAVVLARELSRTDDLEQALDEFMHRRFERVRMVVDTSVQLLRMDQAGGDRRAMGMLRGQAMRALAAPY